MWDNSAIIMTRFSYFVWIILLWTPPLITAELVNVALNKPCYMSSSYTGDGFNNSCSCAINGNTSTTYAQGNCIHTVYQTDRTPNWTVYLGQDYSIQRITVYARNLLVNERMSQVKVFLDDVDIYTFSYSGDTIRTISDPHLPRTGSRVTLKILNQNLQFPMLNICEVEVFALVGYCNPNPCANGGTCFEGGTTYTCSCTQGYTGTNCLADVNECDQIPRPCTPGNCSNTVGSYTCQFPAGFDGTGTQNCTGAMPKQSSQNMAGPVVGAFLGGVVFATCLWILGLCVWKRRSSLDMSNKQQTEGLRDSVVYGDTSVISDTTAGAPQQETLRQEVRQSAHLYDVSSDTYDKLSYYSNDVMPAAAAYTNL